MTAAPLAIFCALVNALLLFEIIYELRSGQIRSRNWKPIATRAGNPMVYWSTMGVQVFLALIAFCFLLGAIFEPKTK